MEFRELLLLKLAFAESGASGAVNGAIVKLGDEDIVVIAVVSDNLGGGNGLVWS